jgi:hypothetical protein
LVPCVADNAEALAEAAEAVCGTGLAETGVGVSEKSTGAGTHALSVGDELVRSAGNGGSSLLALPDATAEAVGTVASEAASVDADAFKEEETGVADAHTDAIAEILAIGALGSRNAS